jgi:nidogen-like
MMRNMGLLCAATLFAASAAFAQKGDPNPGQALGGLPCPLGATRLCIPLDQTFSVVRMDASTGGNGQADPLDPCQRNDDDSSLAIPLGFNFDFYGSTFTDVFINDNGNVSFGTPFAEFTATGFPVAGFPMIAPFWADVDSRDALSGIVYFKSEAHRFTVIWDHVGYYNTHSDKQNTFEVILSDGTDPIVGIGSNVCFCYDDMQWTTGDASGGIGGFGGVPATVGANRGDGIDFFQIGLFDHAGTDYDGPGGNNDGVDFLDNQRTCFNTGSATNIPPSFVNLPDGCLQAFVGTPLTFTVRAISPELGQTTTITVMDGGLANFSCVNTPGNPAQSVCTFTPDASQVGTHTVIYTATDDFQPPASSTATICIDVSECPTMIGFDENDGEIPRGTEITNQFAFQGVLVSGVSFDTGHVGVFTNRNGGPGSDTDDLNPASAPNFITTMPRDPFDPRESDFGKIRFDFVDPRTGSPLAVDFVSLKFLDVEDSGLPGRGTSFLRGIRANGTNVDVNVPAGPNGGIQRVQVGSIGGEDAFVAAEAYVGDVDDSAAVDDLCFHQIETAIQLACTATPNVVPRGGTISLRLGIKNTTNQQMPVQVTIEAGNALLSTGLRHVVLSRQLVLPRHFDDTAMADRELVEIQVPTNVRQRLIGIPLQILTRATNPTAGWDYARDRFVFVIQ